MVSSFGHFREGGDGMGIVSQIRRSHRSKKRIQRIHFSTRDKWRTVVIAVLIVLAAAAGAWLGMHYED
jgi:hypothetical protein